MCSLKLSSAVRDAATPPLLHLNVNEQISPAQIPRVVPPSVPGENGESRSRWRNQLAAALRVRGQGKTATSSPIANHLLTVCASLEIGRGTCLPREEGRNKHPPNPLLLPFWWRKTPIVWGVPRLLGAAKDRAGDSLEVIRSALGALLTTITFRPSPSFYNHTVPSHRCTAQPSTNIRPHCAPRLCRPPFSRC